MGKWAEGDKDELLFGWTLFLAGYHVVRSTRENLWIGSFLGLMARGTAGVNDHVFIFFLNYLV